MQRRRRGLIAAALVVISVGWASSASAATEVGEPCVADSIQSNRTLVVFTGRDNPLMQPVVPEEPDQVITGWKVQVGPGQPSLPQRLEVYRVLNEAQEYRKEAQSTTEVVGAGSNFFPAQIPVESWTGYLGLYGPNGTFSCGSTSGVGGVFEGSAGLGETRAVKGAIGLGVPLTARIESDRDGDGYGDETQDKCPQSGIYYEPCPHVTLALWTDVRRRSIRAHVMATSEATVQVFGQVGWGIRPKGKPGAGGSPPKARLIVGLSGGTKDVVGEDARYTFRIRLPKPVLRRLGKLTPDESLKAKIAARYTDLAGRVEVKRITVRLQGREGTG